MRSLLYLRIEGIALGSAGSTGKDVRGNFATALLDVGARASGSGGPKNASSWLEFGNPVQLLLWHLALSSKDFRLANLDFTASSDCLSPYLAVSC